MTQKTYMADNGQDHVYLVVRGMILNQTVVNQEEQQMLVMLPNVSDD